MSFHSMSHRQVIEAIMEKRRVLTNPRARESRFISLFLFRFVRVIQPPTTITKNGIWQISLKESNTGFRFLSYNDRVPHGRLSDSDI